MTIDIAGLPVERIAFAPSPLAELCMTLHALSQPAHHPGLHSWTRTTTASLDPCLAERLLEADFMWRSSFSDVFMAFAGIPGGSGRPGATLAEELDVLDRMDDERFVLAALEHCWLALYNEGGAPSPLTDAAARAKALETAAARGPARLEFTRRLLDDPSTVRVWLRRLLEDCDEAFFAETWRRIEPRQTADVRHKTEVLRHRGLAAVLKEVSSALSVDEAHTVITADKMVNGQATATDPEVGQGLLFIPTNFGWPHLLVLHAPGWMPVVHYPLESPELASEPPSVEQVQRRMEALAHPMRMRLCRSLARAPYTTSELARVYAISAPEVSRHLAVLKRAGLIHTRRQGRYVQHQLDLTVVARIGPDLIEGVLR
ncbi:ArsR family transcriptional regulator [Streptomyces sp. RSD-27]|nr:ArsR family transcriptional regulator [Streptomyces sp. RSD-27]